MRPYGKGILKNSQVFFHTPSESDASLFLYPLCMGLYECNDKYYVERKNYDSFLLLYVINGSLYLSTDGSKKRLGKEEFALVDCYKPHIYGSNEGCKILWLHFDGALARDYYNFILQSQKSNVVSAADKTHAYRYLSKLYSAMANHVPVESPLISKYIINILTEFMHHSETSIEDNESEMEKVRIYINENIEKPLSLEEIAAQANLSVYYFTRCFKKTFGYTPHEYLIKARLNTACFYLVSTTDQVKEIAYKCGFSNESNFCTCFKKNLSCTPAEYRAQRLR